MNGIIRNAPQVVKDAVREKYGDRPEEEILEEILTHTLGWIGEGSEESPGPFGKAFKTLEGRAWYNRLWDAIKNLWKAFATKMGWNKADIEGIDKMKPEAAARKILAEMAKGRYFGDVPTGGEGTRNAMAESSPSASTPSRLGKIKDWFFRGGEDNYVFKNHPADWSMHDTSQLEFDRSSKETRLAEAVGSLENPGEFWKVFLPTGTRRVAVKTNNGNVAFLRDVNEAIMGGRLGYATATERAANGKFRNAGAAHMLPHIAECGFVNGKSVLTVKEINDNFERCMDTPVKYDRQNRPYHEVDIGHGVKMHIGTELIKIDGKWKEVPISMYSSRRDGDSKRVCEWVANEMSEKKPVHLSAQGRAATSTRTEGSVSNSTPENKGANLAPGSAPGDSSPGNIREARRVVLPKPPGSHIMDDERSAREKFTEKYIDSFAPVKTVQDDIGGVQEIVRADGYTDHARSTDLVAAKDKANGRLEYEIRQHQNRVDDITEDVARAALPKQSTADLVDDFNLYLQCMHAPERNRSIAADRGDTYTQDYSEGMGMVTLPGGTGTKMGLSENVATQILNWMRGKYGVKFGMFQRAAGKLYKLLEDDLDRRFAAGRLSADELAFYKDRWHGAGGAPGEWAHYVPLKTDMERLEPDAINSSTAGIRRNEFMKAQGRGSSDIADSPFAAAVLQTEQGIRGSIRNEVANVEANLVRLAESRGNPIAEIVPGDEIRRGRTYSFTFADGETVDASGSMRLVANHPEIHLFKRDGQLYAIRYEKGANGRGLAFAKAAGGDNMGRWGNGTEWVPRFTHWMSAMRTQYSPEFTLSNMLADNLEAVQALVGRYGIGGGVSAFAKAVASEISNMPDLARYLAGGQPRGYVKEFVEAGGLTKGGVASQGFDAETAEIRSNIERFRREQKSWLSMSPMDYAKSIGRNVGRFISFANELLEYSTRAGIYTALRKNGVPVQEAVKFARDATVNFNRKGTAMPYINGLYMFSNASVQGAVRSLQAMGDVHGGQLVAALVAIGVSSAVIDHFLGNDEKRESAGGRNARNLSEYDKKHNVGVPIGGGKQLNLFRFRGPYAAVPYLAKTIANVLLGETSPEDAATTLFREFGDQVTDLVGGNGIVNDKGELDGSLIAQSMAPSLVDPIVQLITGKDYKGDDRRKLVLDKTTPASSSGKDSTGSWYKGIAKFLNRITGGNENRKGAVDIAPEDLRLIAEFIGGGPMRDINNAAATFSNAKTKLSGGEPENTLSQIPFVRRLVREYPESTSRYFDALEEYERDKKEFAKATPERRREMRADKPYLFAGKSLLDGQIDRARELMHLERGEVKVGNSWKKPASPVSEKKKGEYHRQMLEIQARILKKLGK